MVLVFGLARIALVAEGAIEEVDGIWEGRVALRGSDGGAGRVWGGRGGSGGSVPEACWRWPAGGSCCCGVARSVEATRRIDAAGKLLGRLFNFAEPTSSGRQVRRLQHAHQQRTHTHTRPRGHGHGRGREDTRPAARGRRRERPHGPHRGRALARRRHARRIQTRRRRGGRCGLLRTQAAGTRNHARPGQPRACLLPYVFSPAAPAPTPAPAAADSKPTLVQ